MSYLCRTIQRAMRGFWSGIKAYGAAFRILFSRRFWWFLFFPVAALVLLYVGGSLAVAWAGDGLYGLLEEKLSACVEGISWLQWATTATCVLIRMALRVLYFFFFMACGGYLLLIVMSPVYSWLSERTETCLTGRKCPFCFKAFVRETGRGIWVAFRNMVLQMAVSLLLFLCSFIPVVGLLVPFVAFFVSAYFYGAAFIDYAIERKCFSVKQSVRYVNRHAGCVTGIGAVFALALLLPGASLVVCGFVSLLSVIAGAVAVHSFPTHLQRTSR